MCGIVGVASNNKVSFATLELFKSLLLHDVVRGHHATGVAAINSSLNEVGVTKEAIPSYEFLEKYDIDDTCNIYIGHNRWATRGAKDDDDNAHPFTHGTVTGVHNGSLRDQSLLDNHKEFEVDSDNLFHHMSENGLDDTMSKVDGAFALVWYDTKDQTLNFIRNSERPLFVAKLSNGSFVWASEELMLRWLVTRSKTLTFALTKEKEEMVYSLEAGKHLKITFNGFKMKQKELAKVNLHVPKSILPGYSGGSSPWIKKLDASIKTVNSFADNKSYFQLVVKDRDGARQLFEYTHPNGKKWRMYSYTTQKDGVSFSEGDMVYGQVSSIFNSRSHADAYSVNENGDCIVLSNVTYVKPSSFFATGMVKPHVILVPNSTIPTIRMANGNFSVEKIREMREGCKDACSNCGVHFKNKWPAQLYVHQHYDLEESTTHDYLLCSKDCLQSMEEYTESLDAEILEQFQLICDV